MERAQRELLGVLLDALYARGLLAEGTYLSALDLVHSAPDIPPLFQAPACPAEEAQPCEHP